MTKGIRLSSDFGCVIQFLQEIIVSEGGLIHHSNIVRRGFAVHDPSTIGEVELVVGDELFDG